MTTELEETGVSHKSAEDKNYPGCLPAHEVYSELDELLAVPDLTDREKRLVELVRGLAANLALLKLGLKQESLSKGEYPDMFLESAPEPPPSPGQELFCETTMQDHLK